MSDSDDLGEELRDNLQLRRELKDEIAKATDSASQRVSRSFHRIGVGVTYRSSTHTTWAAAELAG